MMTHVRSAPLDVHSAELEAFAADRVSHGKHERAQAARAALETLRSGEAVTFNRELRVIGEAARYTAWVGSRAAVLAELDDAGAGWLHAAREDLARQCARALSDIQSGDHSASAGSIRYFVISE